MEPMSNEIYDYAYVMLKSEKSDTVPVVLSRIRLDPADVINLMRNNQADIGCTLYLTNGVFESNSWRELEFYSGLLWTMSTKSKSKKN